MSGVVGFVNFFVGSTRPVHRGVVEFEAIGVVDQVIEDGIGKCRLVDDIAPSGDR